jgi:hypothetical protein
MQSTAENDGRLQCPAMPLVPPLNKATTTLSCNGVRLANAVVKQVEQVPTGGVTGIVGSFVGVSVGCAPNEAWAFLLWSLNPFASLSLPTICCPWFACWQSSPL